MPGVLLWLLACGLWLLPLTGCSSDGGNDGPSMRQRQEAAERDPFSYDVDVEDQDISGGDIHEFDREGMKRDLDHVFN